jgi:uncharacterized membrane protein YhaH (DUF805 family)
VNLFSLLFGFQGRITRAQYWLGSMGAGVASALIIFTFALMFAPMGASKTAPAEMSPAALIAFGAVMMAMGWCGLALQVKRFHDRGRSGYFALAPLVPWVMIVTAVVGGAATDAPAGHVAAQTLPWFGVLGLMNIWLLIDLGLLSGTNGPNKYDHTPSAPAGAAPKTISSLDGAAQAMERAIASGAAMNAAAPARPAPAPAPRLAATPSFGRRATR